MSEKVQQSLSTFMKKQMHDKASHKVAAKASANAASKTPNKGDAKGEEGKEGQNAEQEEMSEEEQLEEAKKASKNKAAQIDQTDMIKKMILQNIARYTLLISMILVIFVGLVKFGPAIAGFFNGMMYKALMALLGK